MTPILTQTQTARAVGMSPRAFTAQMAALITHDGFPPPVMGDLNNGRNGPRRRWLASAVTDWLAQQSKPITAQTRTPANDIAESPQTHYR